MILPKKHLQLAESLFGFGGYLLKLLDKPLSIDQLWAKFEKINNTNEFPTYHSFDDFILALNFLFLIGAIKQNLDYNIEYVSN